MDRRAPRGNGSDYPIDVPGSLSCFADGRGTERHVSLDWRPGPGEWADWMGYGPRGNRYNPHASPPRTEPELAWTHDFDDLPLNQVETVAKWTFSIAGGTVFGVFDSELHALDAANGEVRWRRPSTDDGTVFYVDGRLYHRTEGQFYPETSAYTEALTLAGDVEWRLDEGEEDAIVVGETDGYVYTYTRDGRTGWHDADTGEWLGRSDAAVFPEIVADGRVYGITENSLVVYAHDGEALMERWRTQFSSPHGSGHLVLADGRLYRQEQGGLAASQHGPVHQGHDHLETYSLDGELLERERLEENLTLQGLIVADGIEYWHVQEFHPDGGFDSTHLLARDTDERWRRSFPDRTSAPLVAGDTLVVSVGGTEEEKALLALDAVSGERLWAVEGIGGGVAVVGDTIYVVGDEVAALRAG